MQQCLDNNQNVEGEYLTYLLSNTQMSINDVYGSISELLLAGVGTVNVHLYNFAFNNRFNQMYQQFFLLCLFTEVTLHPPPPPRRPPIASHGLCTCCPNTLNARKSFLKKDSHQYQQTGHLLLRR